MTGISRRHLIDQERDRHLLRELALLRVIDRDQAKQVAPFGSTTRANARLLALTQVGLLRRYFVASHAGGKKALYALSAKGAQLVGVPYRGLRRTQNQMLVADFSVEHQLAVNDLYCRLRYQPLSAPGVSFTRWVGFHESISPALKLIPDGYVEFGTPTGTIAAFLETDLGSESLSVWKEKARNYLQLAVSGDYSRIIGKHQFRVLVIAHSERRALSIRAAVSTVTQKLFWFASSADALTQFFADIWWRSTNDVREPLMKIPS